jgi:hypothetical protein
MVRFDRSLKFAFGNEPSSTDQTKGGMLELTTKQRKNCIKFLVDQNDTNSRSVICSKI